MNKFKEYLEAKETSKKTTKSGISDKDKKILKEIARKGSIEDYEKEGRLPNYVNVDRSKMKGLPDISIGFDDKNYPPKYETQKFKEISFSSGRLNSKKEIEELISVLTKLKGLDCLK